LELFQNVVKQTANSTLKKVPSDWEPLVIVTMQKTTAASTDQE